MHIPIALDELRDAIQLLHQAVPKFGLTAETLPQVVRVYREALEDFDKETVNGAVKMILRSSEKFPTPSLWRATCKDWLKHNRVQQEWKGAQDRDGRDIACRTCRSVARFAVLVRSDGTEYTRFIAPCDPERHSQGELIVPRPENFVTWAE